MASLKKTTIIIYLSPDKKHKQVVTPSPDYFKGDWSTVLDMVCGGNYHSYLLI